MNALGDERRRTRARNPMLGKKTPNLGSHATSAMGSKPAVSSRQLISGPPLEADLWTSAVFGR